MQSINTLCKFTISLFQTYPAGDCPETKLCPGLTGWQIRFILQIGYIDEIYFVTKVSIKKIFSTISNAPEVELSIDESHRVPGNEGKSPVCISTCGQVIMDQFYADLHAKLMERSIDTGNRHGCRLWTGALTSGGYGRMAVRWSPGVRTDERVHKVDCMIKYRCTRDTFPGYDLQGKRVEVSHLCHQKLCVNPAHLVVERHEVNQARIHCVAQGHCSNDHVPACII